jgi:hypothetical protein
MNTNLIRINADTKLKLDQLLLERALERKDRRYSYAKLIDDLLEEHYCLLSKSSKSD